MSEMPIAVSVDMSRSPHARLRPLPITAITLHAGFWADRAGACYAAGLPALYRQLVETGRIDNFRRASGKLDIPFQGRYYFNDTDVYKWLEAASYALAVYPDHAELREQVNSAVAEIADAQDASGYVDTYFSVDRIGERWTNFDLHEMYCAGHLIQAGIAHYRCTGERSLLEISIRFADHICSIFGLESEGKRRKIDGHEEIEMALVELYRVTGDSKYLAQAQFFIDQRGQGLLGSPYNQFEPSYAQDAVVFRELSEMVGHAVRMLYLDCGAADLYAETGEAALAEAMERQWANLTTRREYITGGVGARGHGEAFGEDYELPSEQSYAETCAAIASIMWNWRMLLLSGEAKYADIMERVLYNGFLSGVSLTGDEYFYVNPLADSGNSRRAPWFECACCPPNVARTLTALSGMVASVSDNGVWLHLYTESAIHAELAAGSEFRLEVATRYPWDGEIAITIAAAPDREATVHLRIPGWAKNAALLINGAPVPGDAKPGSYAALARVWQPGDTIRLTLPMPVRRIVAHPYAIEAAGHVALQRGPIVYCIEQADNPGVDIRAVRLPKAAEIEARFDADLLGGVVSLHAAAIQPEIVERSEPLYRDESEIEAQPDQSVALAAIPYYAWANRAPGAMAVWIRSS